METPLDTCQAYQTKDLQFGPISVPVSYTHLPPDEVDGLILLGDYLYGDYPPANTLTVYGTLNQNVEGQIDYKMCIRDRAP